MKQEEIKDVEGRILDAAKQVFIRKGFASATMGDIALEAGIGRTSLNYYYRTKEMLFERILGNLMEMLLPDIDRIIEEDTHYREKTREIIRLYLKTLRGNQLIPLFVVNELQRDPQHLFSVVLRDSRRIQPLIKLRQLLEADMREGRIRKMPVIDFVSTLISLIVFPFLIRRPLTDIFLEGDEAGFEAFLDRRADFIFSVLDNLFNPENN